MNNKLDKLGTMDMKKLIITMSLPAMISMIVQALYNIVDSIFVAKISEQALTALSIAFPIQLVIIAIFVGLGVGVNSFMSRKLGEGNKNDAINAAEHGLVFGVIMWIILAVSSFFLPEIFLKLFTDDPIVLNYAIEYIRIVMLFSFGSILAEVCMNILRVSGDMISSMKIQLTGALINIILDPILIFGLLFMPELGVRGAAIATVSGQMCAMFYAFILVIRNKNVLALNIKKFHYSKLITREVSKVGIPAIFMTMLGSVMVSVINLILAGFSDTSIAVFGAYFKLQSFVYMPVFGLTQGLMPIIGYNYGAKNMKRVIEAVKYGCLFAVLIMLLGMSIFQIFPEQLLMLFSSTDEMMAIGINCLRIISIGFVFSGIAIVLGVTFQAFGQANISLIISFSRQIVVLLPIAIIASKVFGLNGVWIAFPIAEISTSIIATYYVNKVYKNELKYVESEKEFSEAIKV